jgi:hypothetical protein
MKRYKIIVYLFIALVTTVIGCTEDGGPDIEDHFLNYEIPDVQIKENCTVGVYLLNNGSNGQSDAIWGRLTSTQFDPAAQQYSAGLQPAAGNWKHGNFNYTQTEVCKAMVATFQQYVDWAVEAGIDFFILPLLGENANALYPNNLNVNDAKFYDLFTGRLGSDGLPPESTTGTRVNLKGLKYVVMVNSGNFTGSLSQTMPIENVDPTTITGVVTSRVQRFYEYMRRVSDYFSDGNYFTVNGKPMVVFGGTPHNFYALDTRAFYDGMRSHVKTASGKDVYIVAQQDAWTPSPRFQYTFGEGHVDAVTIKNEGGMYNNTNVARATMYPQFIDQNWNYNKNFLWDTWQEDFIPSAVPAYDRWVQSGGNYNFPIMRHDTETFITYCNIAKRNLGKNRIVFVDSFNDWRFATAIEPTDPAFGSGYGTKYLEIVKQQFKVK